MTSPVAVDATARSERRSRRRRIVVFLVLILAAWIAIDLMAPVTSDLRVFDALRMARLETEMWRAYYEHRPIALYLGLVTMLRDVNHLPFWRAHLNAWRAARAAVVFQRGHDRHDYEQALPPLEAYFAALAAVSTLPFDAVQAARLELEWWIVHRESRARGKAALADAVARAAAALYATTPEQLARFAEHRTVAMLQRDELAAGARAMTDADWSAIEAELRQAYQDLALALH